MADIEKVKKGLVCCTNMDRCFGKCPYDDEYDDVVDCTSELAKDALEAIEEQQAEIERLNALLKEQQARLLTLEEVMEHYSIPISKADIERYNDYAEDIIPLYFDFPTCDGWAVHWRGYDNVSAYLREWEKDYGITWRCWTDKPTEEQRKAIPWETH